MATTFSIHLSDTVLDEAEIISGYQDDLTEEDLLLLEEFTYDEENEEML